MRLDLHVYRATPSLNEFHNLRRAQQWKYRQLRRTWLHEIGVALLQARANYRVPLTWPRPPRARVRVEVTRYAPEHHWLDPDNLVGGLKPVLDALTAHEVIDDDTAAAIDLQATQRVSGSADYGPRWTEIRLSLDPPVVREIHA